MAKDFDGKPGMFTKSGHRKGSVYCGRINLKTKAPESEDTKYRKAVVKEIEERDKKGEDMDIVLDDIVCRPEIINNFIYIEKDEELLKSVLKDLFKRMVESKKKNHDKYAKLNYSYDYSEEKGEKWKV